MFLGNEIFDHSLQTFLGRPKGFIAISLFLSIEDNILPLSLSLSVQQALFGPCYTSQRCCSRSLGLWCLLLITITPLLQCYLFFIFYSNLSFITRTPYKSQRNNSVALQPLPLPACFSLLPVRAPASGFTFCKRGAARDHTDGLQSRGPAPASKQRCLENPTQTQARTVHLLSHAENSKIELLSLWLFPPMCFKDGQTGTKEHLQKPLSAAHAHRHQTRPTRCPRRMSSPYGWSSFRARSPMGEESFVYETWLNCWRDERDAGTVQACGRLQGKGLAERSTARGSLCLLEN